MAKKTTLLLIVSVLLIAMSAFVACKQNPIDPPKPDPSTPVANVAGEVSGNKVYNGEFDTGSESDLVIEEGSTMKYAEGAGVAGGAMEIFQGNNYGQCYVEATDLYGRGKSYYVSASFKINPDTNLREKPMNAHISYTVVSGAVMDAISTYKWDGYYDCDDIYGGEFLTDDDAYEIFGLETNDPETGVEINEEKYETVAGVIPATEIDRLLATTTQTYASGGSEQTIQYLLVCFFVGEYQDEKVGPGQKDYGYYIDNVVIKDLNKELPAQGWTYKKESPEEPEEGEVE